MMSDVSMPDKRVFTRTDKEMNGLCTGPVARSPRGDRQSPKIPFLTAPFVSWVGQEGTFKRQHLRVDAERRSLLLFYLSMFPSRPPTPIFLSCVLSLCSCRSLCRSSCWL